MVVILVEKVRSEKNLLDTDITKCQRKIVCKLVFVSVFKLDLPFAYKLVYTTALVKINH